MRQLTVSIIQAREPPMMSGEGLTSVSSFCANALPVIRHLFLNPSFDSLILRHSNKWINCLYVSLLLPPEFHVYGPRCSIG